MPGCELVTGEPFKIRWGLRHATHQVCQVDARQPLRMTDRQVPGNDSAPVAAVRSEAFVSKPAHQLRERVRDKRESLEFAGQLHVDVDGELPGMLPALFEVMPGALELICP